jgi:hypothetical protein
MTPPDRLRILHVLGGLNRGGVETWLLNVMRTIDRRRFEMHFLVHTAEPGAYDAAVRGLGGRIIPCPNPSSPWRYGRALRRVLREHGRYDVVHSHVHHFSGHVLGVARSAGVPTRIAHSHTDSSLEDAEAGAGRRLYLRTMRRWIHRHASAGSRRAGRPPPRCTGRDGRRIPAGESCTTASTSPPSRATWTGGRCGEPWACRRRGW